MRLTNWAVAPGYVDQEAPSLKDVTAVGAMAESFRYVLAREGTSTPTIRSGSSAAIDSQSMSAPVVTGGPAVLTAFRRVPAAVPGSGCPYGSRRPERPNPNPVEGSRRPVTATGSRARRADRLRAGPAEAVVAAAPLYGGPGPGPITVEEAAVDPPRPGAGVGVSAGGAP